MNGNYKNFLMSNLLAEAQSLRSPVRRETFSLVEVRSVLSQMISLSLRPPGLDLVSKEESVSILQGFELPHLDSVESFACETSRDFLFCQLSNEQVDVMS